MVLLVLEGRAMPACGNPGGDHSAEARWGVNGCEAGPIPPLIGTPEPALHPRPGTRPTILVPARQCAGSAGCPAVTPGGIRWSGEDNRPSIGYNPLYLPDSPCPPHRSDPVTITRRTFLQLGAVGGLSLANVLRLRAEAGGSKPRAVIMVCLAGGPSHMDMYDMKPDAPADYRGEFKPIRTNVPGFD